ncbi:MAG: alkaline phosphatase PafA [Chitinophagaceae bacterium]|nr:alkaline phosphatase PafA [Chitinophagaceae bacterium]
MRKLLTVLLLLNTFLFLRAETYTDSLSRPKLVVGIVVDQMRWDFLYRYYDRYLPNGGFKRMLHQGFSCENTLIPYAPTVTACGHACIYTGSIPAINGIAGNEWWDNKEMRDVYCVEDNVRSVGTEGPAGAMSPKNMLTTSICDELRIATNFRSKVIGIAIKDRGGILPAGHSANAAYWYESRSGNWITSAYYMNELPKWVRDFNASKWPDKYYAEGWNTLYPVNTYMQSSSDEKTYEAKTFGADQKKFPYDLKKFIGTNYGVLPGTPHGNSITTEFAKAAINAEKLGADVITDFLTLSYSSPDYIGHAYGPNSVEVEDNYLRLDKELGEFFGFLDAKIGQGQYLVFLSADHGVAHVPVFLKENKIPAGVVAGNTMPDEMGKAMKEKFGSDKLVASLANYQLYLDHRLIDSLKLDTDAVKKWLINYVSNYDGVDRAFETGEELTEQPLNSRIKSMLVNGYHPRRSGDIQIILKPQWFSGYQAGTTHGAWYPYDSHIPLLWYGWKIKPGKLNREVHMTDIAPTIAALLHIQMPSGNVGHVIEEVVR